MTLSLKGNGQSRGSKLTTLDSFYPKRGDNSFRLELTQIPNIGLLFMSTKPQ